MLYVRSSSGTCMYEQIMDSKPNSALRYLKTEIPISAIEVDDYDDEYEDSNDVVVRYAVISI